MGLGDETMSEDEEFKIAATTWKDLFSKDGDESTDSPDCCEGHL